MVDKVMVPCLNLGYYLAKQIPDLGPAKHLFPESIDLFFTHLDLNSLPLFSCIQENDMFLFLTNGKYPASKTSMG